jgi:hypothetical protein
MKMTRRGFLGMLAAAVAAPVLDPEKLLWVPGATLISIPAPSPYESFNPMMDEMNRITLEFITPRLMDSIFTRSPLVYRLLDGSGKSIVTTGGRSIFSPVDFR